MSRIKECLAAKQNQRAGSPKHQKAHIQINHNQKNFQQTNQGEMNETEH